MHVKFVNTALFVCKQCNQRQVQETVYQTESTNETREGGFEIVTHKRSLSTFKCLSCGDEYKEESNWAESSFPRGDGSFAWLKQRALVMAKQQRIAAKEALRDLLLADSTDEDLLKAAATVFGGNKTDKEDLVFARACHKNLIEQYPQNACHLIEYLQFMKPLLLAQDEDQVDFYAYRDSHILAFESLTKLCEEVVSTAKRLAADIGVAAPNFIFATNVGDYGAIITSASNQNELAIDALLLASRASRTKLAFAEAEQLISNANALGPSKQSVAYLNHELGLNYEARGHYALALPCLRAALGDNPNSVPIMLAVLRNLIRAKKEGEAEILLTNLHSADNRWMIDYLIAGYFSRDEEQLSILQATEPKDLDLEQRMVVARLKREKTSPWEVFEAYESKACPYCSSKNPNRVWRQQKYACGQRSLGHQAATEVWYKTRLLKQCAACKNQWFGELIEIKLETEL